MLRRQQIVDAATEVLEAVGLRASTLEDSAVRVGLTRAGLLHYFGSRDAMPVAVFEQRDEADIAAAAQSAVPGDSVADAFERSVRWTSEFPGWPACTRNWLLKQWTRRTPSAAESRAAYRLDRRKATSG